MPCIYQITNLINDKFYIGSTIRPTYIRKYEHLSELRNNKHCNKHLQRSFNKYGEENFKFEILEEFKFPKEYSKLLQSEYLVCRELYLVDIYNAEYNIRKDPTTGNSGYHHSEETLKKIADAHNRKPLSKSAIIKKEREQRRIEGRLYHVENKKRKYGVRNKKRIYRKGWEHTSEAKLKISERSSQEDNRVRIRRIQKLAAQSRIDTHLSESSKINMMITKFGKMRKIEIYNKQGELLHTCNFSPEAVEFTGVKRSAISNNLIGLSKSAGDFIFTYKNIN